VSGRTTTKGVEDILQITPDNTRIYVSESDGKTVGGFAVSGRTTTKEEGFYDVLKVVPERTDVFIKPPAGKLFPDGFSVSVYNEQLVPTELFNVSEEGIFMNNEVVMVPNVVTGDTTDQTQTSIYAEGTVLPYNGSPISYRGITYSTAPNPVANFQSEPSWEMGTVIDGNMMGDGFGEFYVYLDGLNPGTLYYYKAFAINEDGQIGYGAQKTFETADPYLLTFTVLETGTGIPIDNAMITIELGDKRITNPAGEYGFQVEEGYWMYSVMAEGYYLIEEEAYVFSDETVTVELDPADYSVVFTVTNASGDPLAGITIYIEEGGETNYCETNGRGIALYNPSEPGEYPFNIYSDNHLPYSGSFEVTDNTTVNVPITLQEIVTHKVTFYVQTPEGNPCQGATIELIPVYKNEGGKAYDPYRITDENGYAIYEDLLPHPTYNYTVNYLSYPVVTGSIAITDHDVEETVQLLDGK
ncbi:MAG: carboxypeptidase regulatory-like domain-containing protein, partial [Rikenellaceae bacterium]|nr:carboxypeptidase regulatory-like domain-containing protein [Rikenellaceae bacterium]